MPGPQSEPVSPARDALAAALERGGTADRVDRDELRATLCGVADALELSAARGSGAGLRVPAEDAFADAAVRGRAAVLRPGRPILLPRVRPTVRLIYLSHPVDAGHDRTPVVAMFLILAPTAAQHDSLLAELIDSLEDLAFLDLLAGCAPAERLLSALRRSDPAALNAV